MAILNWMDRAMCVSHTLILYSWFTYLDDHFHLCSPYLFLYLLKTADTVLVPEPVDSRTQSPVDLGSRGTVTLQRTPTRQSEKEKKHCEGTYSRKPHAREAHMTFSFPFSYLIGAEAGGGGGGGAGAFEAATPAWVIGSCTSRSIRPYRFVNKKDL